MCILIFDMMFCIEDLFVFLLLLVVFRILLRFFNFLVKLVKIYILFVLIFGFSINLIFGLLILKIIFRKEIISCIILE